MMYDLNNINLAKKALREIVDGLTETLNDADTPFSVRTEIATFLWGLKNEFADAVEPTKEIARHTAAPFLRKENEWVYDCEGGASIKVSRQRANYFVNDNSVEPLQRLLGSRFDSIIATKHNLKKGALEVLREDKDLYREVLSLIDIKESKPRVSLRPPTED